MDTNAKNTVRLELTEEQRKKVREAGGKDVDALEFSVEELEQRIAPSARRGILGVVMADDANGY